uniref:PNKD metallo-beta-lactamase domain containing n=1 Tax=Crocodylus porosus TaxID=8502 RepID=A0A7M4FRG8_CROPO
MTPLRPQPSRPTGEYDAPDHPESGQPKPPATLGRPGSWTSQGVSGAVVSPMARGRPVTKSDTQCQGWAGVGGGWRLLSPHPVLDGARIGVGELRFTARHTPGHTVGHMIYVLDGTPPAAPPCLFSGDLLFLSGCGRIFEGTPETMLLEPRCPAPPDARVRPGHEYALECLGFASLLDADNPQLEQKLRWAGQQRLEHRSTCPSTLGEERAYNPFLRTQSPEVQAALGLRRRGSEDGAAFRARVLGELRRRKDHYRAP